MGPPPLELDPPLLEPLSPFAASSRPLEDDDVPQCREQRLTARRTHPTRALPSR
jgi:hypothetical protein